MEALAQGSQEALGCLYDRHASLLLALGLRILDDRARAEDLLHDVFLEVWHHARDFDPSRGTVRAWLVTRMRSRALDRRTTALRQQRLAEQAGRDVDRIESSPEVPSNDGERLHAHLGNMSTELARVIHLAYFEGLSSSEISLRLAIPIGTVKSRTARALAALKQHLCGAGGAA